MSNEKQILNAPVDTTATANTKDNTTSTNGKGVTPPFSALDLLMSNANSDLKKTSQSNCLLKGQVEYAELSEEERKKGLEGALQQIFPCGGKYLAEGFEKMHSDKFRAHYWQEILRLPITGFDVDFAATQGLVDQRGALWVRGLKTKERREVEKLFSDYGYPVTDDGKHKGKSK